MKNAVIYMRVSTDKQDNGLAVQKRDCKAFADREAYTVQALFSDVESRSRSVLERSGLLDALAELKKGDTLIIQKVDRIGTDLELAQVKMICAKRKVALVFADGINDDSPISEFINKIMGAVSGLELDTIRTRTRKALREKRERGEYTGGQVPTGYKAMLNGKLQRDEKGQAIIRRIKDMRANKRTYKDIISTLNAETNKVWHYTQVYRLANRDIDYFKVCL